jgi:hypothetical protein
VIEPYFVKAEVGPSTPATDGAPAPPGSAPTNAPDDSASSSTQQSLAVGLLVAAAAFAF